MELSSCLIKELEKNNPPLRICFKISVKPNKPNSQTLTNANVPDVSQNRGVRTSSYNSESQGQTLLNATLCRNPREVAVHCQKSWEANETFLGLSTRKGSSLLQVSSLTGLKGPAF